MFNLGMIAAGRKQFGMFFASFILLANILWAQDEQSRNAQEKESDVIVDFMEWVRSDKCDPEFENFFDGFLSIRYEWIDTVSHRCLLVDFRPHLLTPKPYILTILAQKYSPDGNTKYWDKIYDDKRYTGFFVVCFDKCQVDSKKFILYCFIPYSDYVGYTIIKLE